MASADDFSDNPDWTALIAERKIQDAIDAGLLDNLPGRGQPIDLSVNPFEPPGMGAVNRMLKANRVLPPWLLLEREIEASRALALGVLARWEAAEAVLRGTPDYPKARDAARAAYLAHILHNNDLVLKYNYSAPFAHRTPVPLMRQTRLREFDALYGTEEAPQAPQVGGEPPSRWGVCRKAAGNTLRSNNTMQRDVAPQIWEAGGASHE